MLKPEDFFSLLSDETRLHCLILLQMKGECCVCDIACALQKIQPKISRHLAILRGASVVSDRRDGAWVYYSLNPNLPAWASRLLSAIAKEASTFYSLDLIGLEERERTPTCCESAAKIKEINQKDLLQNASSDNLVPKKLLGKNL